MALWLVWSCVPFDGQSISPLDVVLNMAKAVVLATVGFVEWKSTQQPKIESEA